jgi:hypothetical protein
MKRSRFAEDQIIGILKEAEAGAKTVKTHRMTTPPINRSTCYIYGKIAGIDGVAFRATNDSHHEVETASETFAYDVSRRGRIWENAHMLLAPLHDPCWRFAAGALAREQGLSVAMAKSPGGFNFLAFAGGSLPD